ncbi:hypothetical protein TPAR_03892 [Tolypocladium paradoxum]|uniref:Uncharacterized protein n=1 Tax=Tolypocladium paradoxum TaxID=94208 RepID=A0A2S4L0D4_9HYPO|nr:hypothetical protein TPAR_03892 [Tolypocladium paradoxum]
MRASRDGEAVHQVVGGRAGQEHRGNAGWPYARLCRRVPEPRGPRLLRATGPGAQGVCGPRAAEACQGADNRLFAGGVLDGRGARSELVMDDAEARWLGVTWQRAS